MANWCSVEAEIVCFDGQEAETLYQKLLTDKTEADKRSRGFFIGLMNRLSLSEKLRKFQLPRSRKNVISFKPNVPLSVFVWRFEQTITHEGQTRHHRLSFFILRRKNYVET